MDGRALGLATALAVAVTGCGGTDTASGPPGDAVAWPASLEPFGGGYPNAGDPCRRVGETAATIDYLDDDATLVGCPLPKTDPRVAALLEASGGRVVASADGVLLISIPLARGGRTPGGRDAGGADVPKPGAAP